MTTPPFRPVTVRLPVDVFEQLAQIADQEQRSLSNMLRLIATGYLEDRQRESLQPHADAGLCPRSPDQPLGFYCTLPADHEGPHVATNGDHAVLSTWP